MSFLVAGGFPMVFILVFGAIALAGAARFALRPTPGRVRPVVAYGAAVGLASVAGFAADLVAVSRAVASNPAWAGSDQLPIVLVVGFGEALSPVVLGAAVLAVVALLCAVGLRRLPPE